MKELYSHQWYNKHWAVKIVGSIEKGLVIKMDWKRETVTIKSTQIITNNDVLSLLDNQGKVLIDDKNNLWEIAESLWVIIRNFRLSENHDWDTVHARVLKLLDDNGYKNIIDENI